MTTLAFILVLTSAFVHASWNFTTKKISGHISVYWAGMLIAGIASIAASLLMPADSKFEPEGIILFILTGIFHLLYFLFLIQAYRVNDLSSAYPVARGLGVLGAAVLGILFLNETLNLLKISGISFILCGIILIGMRKGISLRNNIKHLGYAVLVGLTIICFAFADKKGVQYINPVYYSIGIFALPALLISPYVLLKHRSGIVRCFKVYKVYSIVIGLGSFVSYIIILFVFQLSDLSYVVPVRESSVAIGAVFGFILLKEKITFRKVVAINAITAGLILIKIS